MLVFKINQLKNEGEAFDVDGKNVEATGNENI